MIWTTEILDFTHRNNMADSLSVSPFCKNNPKLRKENLRVQLTTDEQTEYIKCAQDVEYFAHTYCRAEFSEQQLAVLTNPNRFTIGRFERKSGCLTPYAIVLLHEMVFNTHHCSVFLGVSRNSGVEMITQIKKYYEELPFVMKPGVTAWNDTSLIFDNGSRIRAEKLTKDWFVGFTFTTLFVDAERASQVELDHLHRSIFPMVNCYNNSRIMLKCLAQESRLEDYIYRLFSEPAYQSTSYDLMNFSDKPIQKYDWAVMEQIEELIRYNNVPLPSLYDLLKKIAGN